MKLFAGNHNYTLYYPFRVLRRTFTLLQHAFPVVRLPVNLVTTYPP